MTGSHDLTKLLHSVYFLTSPFLPPFQVLCSAPVWEAYLATSERDPLRCGQPLEASSQGEHALKGVAERVLLYSCKAKAHSLLPPSRPRAAAVAAGQISASFPAECGEQQPAAASAMMGVAVPSVIPAVATMATSTEQPSPLVVYESIPR